LLLLGRKRFKRCQELLAACRRGSKAQRIIRRVEAHEQIANLKRQERKEILVFGSRMMWNDMLVAELVHELQLMNGAALFGGGTPIFEAGSPVPLRLMESRWLEVSSEAAPQRLLSDHTFLKEALEGQDERAVRQLGVRFAEERVSVRVGPRGDQLASQCDHRLR
jgi:RibD C-terminal domain